jgi:hypothetical protein
MASREIKVALAYNPTKPPPRAGVSSFNLSIDFLLCLCYDIGIEL